MATEKNEKHKVYGVVEFIREKVNGKKCIELVPFSWLVFDNDDPTKCHCYFPPKEDYNELSEMVKEKREHETTWEKFECKPLKYSKNYKKGLKKLEEAYEVPLQIDSTDSEGGTSAASYTPRSEIDSILQRSQALPKLPTIIENPGPSGLKETQHKDVPNGSSTNNGTGISRMTRKAKKKTSKARLTELQDQTQNPETLLLMEYVAAQCEVMTLVLTEKMDCVRRGCQFDIKKQAEELKESLYTLSIGNTGGRPADPKSKFHCDFPIATLEDFLDFEKSLNPKNESNVEKPESAVERQEALKDMMQRELGDSGKSMKEATFSILEALIKKRVQIQYSAKRRKTIHGAKRDFSATYTYRCLEDYLKVKYNLHGKNPKKMKITSCVGAFLYGSGDREGGATERKKKALLRSLNDEEP